MGLLVHLRDRGGSMSFKKTVLAFGIVCSALTLGSFSALADDGKIWDALKDIPQKDVTPTGLQDLSTYEKSVGGLVCRKDIAMETPDGRPSSSVKCTLLKKHDDKAIWNALKGEPDDRGGAVNGGRRNEVWTQTRFGRLTCFETESGKRPKVKTEKDSKDTMAETSQAPGIGAGGKGKYRVKYSCHLRDEEGSEKKDKVSDAQTKELQPTGRRGDYKEEEGHGVAPAH